MPPPTALREQCTHCKGQIKFARRFETQSSVYLKRHQKEREKERRSSDRELGKQKNRDGSYIVAAAQAEAVVSVLVRLIDACWGGSVYEYWNPTVIRRILRVCQSQIATNTTTSPICIVYHTLAMNCMNNILIVSASHNAMPTSV